MWCMCVLTVSNIPKPSRWWLISIRFVPLSDSSQTLVTLTCVFHAFPHSFSPSLSLTKVTTILSNGAISISRCTKHEQRSHIHVVRPCERTKVSIRLPGSKGDRYPGARQSRRAFRPSPGKSRLIERVNNSRTRFQYFIFHVQFFFSIYILI